MSANLPPIVVTARDHRRLMLTAEHLTEQADPLAAPLMHKLRRATISEPDMVSEVMVTLDIFVTYRVIGKEGPKTHMLIHPDDRMWAPAELSVLTPLGLSLFGLRVGDRASVVGLCWKRDVCVEVDAIGPQVIGGIVPVKVEKYNEGRKR